jgi:hypothetical protein
MESFKNSKGIKVQSSVYPKVTVPFNEWAQNLTPSWVDQPLNTTNIYDGYEEDDLKRKHESIRTILIENGNVEYGDCIIDEICNVVGIPPTTVYYVEGK